MDSELNPSTSASLLVGVRLLEGDRRVSRSSQRRPFVLVVWTILIAAAIWAVGGHQAQLVDAQSEPGADLYAAKCAACHQPFGQGIEGTFPPLSGNDAVTDPDYVEQVIRNGRTGELEVDGVSYNTAMPAVSGLSDGDIDAIVAFVGELGGVTAPAPTPSTVAPSEPPSASAGEQLFTGGKRFENGGGACSSCHTAGPVGNLGGPGLGPNLTNSHETLGGDAGLLAWLSNPPSATMTPIFADKPLTDTELGHLVAFLADAPDADQPSGIDRLLIAGLMGTVVLILGMAIAWRGMRQTYVSRLRSRA